MSAVAKTPDLGEQVKKNNERFEKLEKSFTALADRLEKTPAYPPGANPQQVFGAPHARRGEDVMSSRGFSFLKMFGVLKGVLHPDQAKVETDISERMGKCFSPDRLATGGYQYAAGHGVKFMAPLATSFFPDELVEPKFRHEMKSLMRAGLNGADPDEANWLSQRMGYGRKDLSWLNELTGGALVAPAQQGELIELLRNNEALVNAGARTVPLPPQGRLVYPRQTSPSNAYWVGENAPISQSDVGTGEVTLQAKKLAVLITTPNELIRFASPAAEALIRDDMTKTLALGLDLAGLEGLGGDTRPRGLIHMPNINVVQSSAQGDNGNGLVAGDIYRMIAAVEESNAEFKAWVMRPKTLYRYYQLRSDAVAQGDAAGGFIFNLIREAGDNTPAVLGGYPVTKSTQVSQVQTKGTASNLTYVVGGNFSDLLIGMFGGIEFASNIYGDGAFRNDQTQIRGILTADVAARHDASFVYMPNLLVDGPLS